MRNILLSLLLMSVGFCMAKLPFETHEFRHIYSHKLTDSMNLMSYADLKGDGSEHMILSFPQMQGSAILVQDIWGKSISQVNIAEGVINNIQVIPDPGGRSPWMFASVNTGSAVYMMGVNYTWGSPRSREERIFEAYPRADNLMDIPAYSWNAVLQAKLLEDIDQDGKPELVALALDGYSVNPRGIMAFDFETGALKWFFRSPTNFQSMLFDDFDGDGYKEFILGNIAHNNTELSFNALDDKNGYAVILDRYGKLVQAELMIKDRGEVRMQSADVDQDGRIDIFAQLLKLGSGATSSAIVRMEFDGTRLQRSKQINVPGNLQTLNYPDFLFRFGSNSEHSILANNQMKGYEIYDINLNVIREGPKNISRLLVAGDFLQKGLTKFLVQSTEDELLLLNTKLELIASMRNPMPGKSKIHAHLVNKADKPYIALVHDSSLGYYEIHAISPLLYFYRFIKSYAMWIILLLLLLSIRLMIRLYRRHRALLSAANQSQSGFILVDRNYRIKFINKVAINLAIKYAPHAKVKSLKDCFPMLVDCVQNLKLSRVDYEDTELDIGGVSHKIHVEYFSGYGKSLLISISPPPRNADSEMLGWAETARRLSHHVRRHITNVLLALDPLDDSSHESQKEYLAMVREEIEKIRVFTHAFQRFTEMRSYELKLYDIIPHMEHALQQSHIPKTIKLIKNYKLSSINAFIEPIRFEEALINTINNATEAMADGGTLHISIRIFPKHKSPAGKLSVLVEIEDTGRGIPAKYMQDIWKPFFTTNQSGTGIGIPETRKILDSMRGSMDIQSEEGVGTTVSMWLKGEQDV